MSTTSYPIVRFVDAPTKTATIRYDLQGKSAQVLAAGFSMGNPTVSGDPGAYGASYGPRKLQMTQLVDDVKSVALPLMSKLARELGRRKNWLMFQHSPDSQPVWFRTYQSADAEVSLANTYSEVLRRDAWAISVAVNAEPFARGERVTLSTVTVGNDPTTGTNPCRYVLPTISGDAPTPLRIRMRASTTVVRAEATFLLSLMGSNIAPTSSLMASIPAIGSDTSSVAAGGDMTSGQFYQVTFATQAGMVDRLACSVAGLPFGSYKVLARVRSNGGFSMRLTTPNVQDTVSVGAAAAVQYLDLGDIDFPSGARVEDDFLPGATAGDALPFTFKIQAATSGATTLDIDHVTLVPVSLQDADADSFYCHYTASANSPAADGVWIDGDTESVRVVSSGDAWKELAAPTRRQGGYPYADPTATNVLRLFQTYTPAPGDLDTLSRSCDLVISYQPLWLNLPGS
jgi:hypothetical protein